MAHSTDILLDYLTHACQTCKRRYQFITAVYSEKQKEQENNNSINKDNNNKGNNKDNNNKGNKKIKQKIPRMKLNNVI